MKGLELPINMIIVIAIAVLVLVVVAAYFSGVFFTDTDKQAVQNQWNLFCGQERITGCNGWSPSVSFPINKNSYTLLDMCQKLYGVSTDAPCKTRCCGTT